MILKIAVVAALAMGVPALAQQAKVSGVDPPPANPPQTQAVPADKEGAAPPSASSRSTAARQALKALHGGDPPAKPKPAPKPAEASKPARD